MRLLPLLLVLSLAPACVLTRYESPENEPPRSVDPPDRSDSLPYSHGVLAGDTYYVAGTLGLDPSTGRAPAAVEDEVRAMLDAFRAKLELVGMDMEDLVSVQVFCSDVELYETFNEIYAGYFEGDYPARAFIGSGTLLRGARFEITGIAVRQRPERRP